MVGHQVQVDCSQRVCRWDWVVLQISQTTYHFLWFYHLPSFFAVPWYTCEWESYCCPSYSLKIFVSAIFGGSVMRGKWFTVRHRRELNPYAGWVLQTWGCSLPLAVLYDMPGLIWKYLLYWTSHMRGTISLYYAADLGGAWDIEYLSTDKTEVCLVMPRRVALPTGWIYLTWNIKHLRKVALRKRPRQPLLIYAPNIGLDRSWHWLKIFCETELKKNLKVVRVWVFLNNF